MSNRTKYILAIATAYTFLVLVGALIGSYAASIEITKESPGNSNIGPADRTKKVTPRPTKTAKSNDEFPQYIVPGSTSPTIRPSAVITVSPSAVITVSPSLSQGNNDISPSPSKDVIETPTKPPTEVEPNLHNQ